MSFHYQSIIGIQSVQYGNFLSGRGPNQVTLIETVPWLSSYENWKITIHSDPGKTGTINFGDTIALENNNFSGCYLSGFSNTGTPQICTNIFKQDYEKWQFIDANNPSSTAAIKASDSCLLQLVKAQPNCYAQVTGQDITSKVPLTTQANASQFRLINLTVYSGT